MIRQALLAVTFIAKPVQNATFGMLGIKCLCDLPFWGTLTVLGFQ